VGPTGAVQRGARAVTATDWLELFVILLLVFGNAVFAATETAITRMNRVRVMRLSEERQRGAKALTRIVEDPAPYLNVVLLLTLVCTITGTTLAASLAVRHFHRAGEVISTVAMTLVLFVFAEVTPKTLAIQRTDGVALRVAPILVWIARLFSPIAALLLKIANVIMPGKGLPAGPYVTEQDLRAYAEVASDEDQIEEEEKDLIHSIFEFGDTIVREVMVPRPDIVAIEDDKTLRDVQALVLEHGYSRIPVYHEDLDDIVGVVFAKDVLKAIHQDNMDMPLTEICRPAHFVPESKKVADLLREMQKEKYHQAFVTDEYGSVTGIVSLEDLLEELVGEITDEYDREEPSTEQVSEGVFRVTGKTPIDDVNDLLDAELPDEEWDTVGGLVLDLFGKIPSAGEETTFQGLQFKAEEVRGRRVFSVLITRVAPQASPDGEVVGE
jgi:CBS domain containing-hemolysin-like protein